MANPPQLQQMAFAAGIDQSQHGEVLEPSAGFVTLENVRQDRRGGVSKRLGFEALPLTRMGSAQGRTSGKRVFDVNGIACVFDGESIDSYSESHNTFVQTDTVTTVEASTRDIATTGDLIDDVIAVNGYVISSTYVVSEVLRGTVDEGIHRNFRLENMITIETEGGTLIRGRNPVFSIFRQTNDPAQPGQAEKLQPEQHLQRSRLAAHGTWVFLFVTDPSEKKVHAFKLNTETPLSEWTALENPIASTYVFGEIGVASGSDRVWVAYTKFNSAASGPYSSPRTQLVSFSGVQGALDSREIDLQTIITTASGASTWRVLGGAYDIQPTGQRLLLATKVVGISGAAGSGLVFTGFPGFGATLGDASSTGTPAIHKWYSNLINEQTQNISGAAPSELVDSVYVTEGINSGADPYSFILTVNGFNSVTCVKTQVAQSGEVTWQDAAFCVGACAASKPVAAEGKFFILATPGGWFRSIDLSGLNTIRSVLLNGSESLRNVVLCDASRVWESKCLFPIANASPELVTFSAYGLWSSNQSIHAAYGVKRSASSFSIEILSARLALKDGFLPCEHNGVTYFTGGIVAQFDGSKLSEGPFLHRPVKPDVKVSELGEDMGMIGAFRYVVTYEATDALGNTQTSAVSDPVYINNTSGKPIKITVYPVAISSRLERSGREPTIKINVWRTPVGGEPPYQLVHTFENTTIDPDAFVLDSQLYYSGNRLLYGTGSLPGTNGAAQDRRAPPYATALASYNGMLIVASGRDLWYSGQAIDGEGVWFNPAFVVTVPDNQNITALAVLESTLYAFTARSVYAVAGDAPSDNGFSGGLGVPRRLAADVGCIDARSVVVCTLGIFFQSARGIELLNRGGSVTFIGQNVQDTIAAYPVITSATLDDFAGLVRFTAQSKDEATGVHLVFDLTTNLWQSVDRVTGSVQNAPASHACMITKGGRRRFAWLSADGTLYAEKSADDERAYFDGVSWVSMAAEFGWTKFGGIQGRHFLNRALLLAKRETSANVCTSVFYDYSDEPTSIVVRSASTVDRVNSSINRIQLDNVFANESAGVSVKLRIEDRIAAGGFVGNGKGSTWLSVSFEGVPVEGATLLPEGAS